MPGRLQLHYDGFSLVPMRRDGLRARIFLGGSENLVKDARMKIGMFALTLVLSSICDPGTVAAQAPRFNS